MISTQEWIGRLVKEYLAFGMTDIRQAKQRAIAYVLSHEDS
jgi:hypothetical protein